MRCKSITAYLKRVKRTSNILDEKKAREYLEKENIVRDVHNLKYLKTRLEGEKKLSIYTDILLRRGQIVDEAAFDWSCKQRGRVNIEHRDFLFILSIYHSSV